MFSKYNLKGYLLDNLPGLSVIPKSSGVVVVCQEVPNLIWQKIKTIIIKSFMFDLNQARVLWI